MRAFAVCLSVLSLSAPAWSQESPIDQIVTACLEAPAGMSTQGQIECIDQSAVAWDRELNRAFRALMQAMDKPRADALRGSQRLWVKFRDAELAALSDIYGSLDGTLYRVMHAQAVSALTRDRAKQLQILLDDVESAGADQ